MNLGMGRIKPIVTKQKLLFLIDISINQSTNLLYKLNWQLNGPNYQEKKEEEGRRNILNKGLKKMEKFK